MLKETTSAETGVNKLNADLHDGVGRGEYNGTNFVAMSHILEE